MRIRVLAAAAVLVAAGCAGPVAVAPRAAVSAPDPVITERGTVTKVTDGDTVHVSVDGRDVDVRILGVDTPETKKPRTPVQCWGPQASGAAKGLLEGKAVTLRADPTQAQVDRYGRVLRYVTLPDGRDYSLLAVTDGAGRAYKVSGRAPQEWPALVAAQQRAQDARAGLWGPPCLGRV